MRRAGATLLVIALAAGCGEAEEPEPEPVVVKKLNLETAGLTVDELPEAIAGGRLSCIGRNAPADLDGSHVELTGYIRLLSDPGADEGAPPAATVKVFDEAGDELGKGFGDPAKAGRASVSVPVPETGFAGHAVVSEAGYLDYRFETSRPVTDTSLSGWAWLTTPEEATERAAAANVTLDATRGILVGSVHDCDGFGVENAVVTVGGSSLGVKLIEGFDLAADRTFTTEAGRFAMGNLDPGPVVVEAYGRLKDGDDLVLLSSMEAVIEANKMTAVDLQPLVGAD